MEVYYSSIKHHKFKRRVELKESKILEINHFGQFHKYDNSQLHTTSYGLSNLCTISLLTTFMNTTLLYCKYDILNLSNSYILQLTMTYWLAILFLLSAYV